MRYARRYKIDSAHPAVAGFSLRKWIVKVLRVVVPFGVSVALVVWLLHKIDPARIGSVLHDGVRFEFIVLMMFITMLSHIIRGIRWGIQLRAAGVPRMSPVAESVSIFGAYALNLVVPYLGEAWRCVYVSKREKVKLSTIVGTDLGDRGTDAVVVVMLLLLALVVASAPLHNFFQQYPLGRFLDALAGRWELWAGIMAALVFFCVACRVWRNTRFFSSIDKSINRMWQGFKVIFHMKGRWAYLFLTIGIWTCYFMETYSCFFAFPFTRDIIYQPDTAYGLVPGLVVFVFGSFSMAVPSNGGLGPWNIAVMYALMLYGVGQEEAAGYSIVAWGFQSVMLILLGIFAAFYIMLDHKKTQSGTT